MLLTGIMVCNPSLNFFVVRFRGSSSFSNYWTDAKTDLVPYSHCSGCLVHDGFAAAEETVVPSGLISVLETLHNQFPNYPAVFTGHSLGMSYLINFNIWAKFLMISLQVVP